MATTRATPTPQTKNRRGLALPNIVAALLLVLPSVAVASEIPHANVQVPSTSVSTDGDATTDARLAQEEQRRVEAAANKADQVTGGLVAYWKSLYQN